MHKVSTLLKITTEFLKAYDKISILSNFNNQKIIELANDFISHEPYLTPFVAQVNKDGELTFKNETLLHMALIIAGEVDFDIYVDLNECKIINYPNDYTVPLAFILNSKYAFKFKDELEKFLGKENPNIERILNNYQNLGSIFEIKNVFSFISIS